MKTEEIKKILEESKTIAMIGVSSEKKKEDPKNIKRKPANVVMKYMQDFGYKVIPINPFAKGEIINGEKFLKIWMILTLQLILLTYLDLRKKQ